MKRSLKLILWKRYLPKMLALPAPSIMPRSGEKGKIVNAFVIYLFNENNDLLYMIDRAEEESIIAREWDEGLYKFDKEVKISYEEIINLKPEIIHYNGLQELRFYSIEEYLIKGVTKFIYLSAALYRFKNWFIRYRFSKKDLIIHERIDILRVLIECHVNATNAQHSMTANELFTHMHTHLWYIHPKAEVYKKTLQLNLDSLEITGNLRKEQQRYFVTGKAIETITRYELEESRYDQQLASQNLMGRLTIAIAVLTLLSALGTLVQAHIVEVPTIFDFRHKE